MKKIKFSQSPSSPQWKQEELIEAYLDGQLPDGEMDVFEEAYFNDNELLETVKFRRELKHCLKEEGKYSLSSDTSDPDTVYSDNTVILNSDRQHLAYRFLKLAAIFMLLSGFSFILFKYNLFSSKLSETDFQPSSYFEERVNSQFHSSYGISIVSPEARISKDAPITLHWQLKLPRFRGGNPSSEEQVAVPQVLYLKIFNNKETLVLSTPVRENQYILKQEFAPGLYYWLLETDEETLHVGKLQINH